MSGVKTLGQNIVRTNFVFKNEVGATYYETACSAVNKKCDQTGPELNEDSAFTWRLMSSHRPEGFNNEG